MIDYIYIIMAAMGIIVGFIFGYMIARYYDNRILNIEKKIHETEMRRELERHAKQVAKNGVMFDVEKRELTQRHTKILDEIAQVTGIDVVVLPSFGTVHLNHSKNVREAMKALYEEDESDGVYD